MEIQRATSQQPESLNPCPVLSPAGANIACTCGTCLLHNWNINHSAEGSFGHVRSHASPRTCEWALLDIVFWQNRFHLGPKQCAKCCNKHAFSIVNWRRCTVQPVGVGVVHIPVDALEWCDSSGRTGHATIVTRWIDANSASAMGSRRLWRQGRVPEVCSRSTHAHVGK